MQTSNDFSTKKISVKLINEICNTLSNLDYGSVELFVNNSEVTQITRRNIKKTNGHSIEQNK
ncbi:MAG: hypothetical protein UR98_C0016G0004 [Parcubacteria group bacterium GW2011_GWA1_36_12]|nr:MAG: hypothetical protein UR98_C0016G0004 [Parcubacteria group bacterium GW2011_GWA1_36_12]